MIIGRVIGNVVSVIKDSSYNGFKLLVVQEMNIDGTYDDNFYISADLIGVGNDEVVMVTCGTSSRATEETHEKPIDSVIVAKINRLIFKDREVELE
ncbi:MAG: EutN/CcmL family microcompartment protein [Actinobacteria bacterium]|jgi:ethanolamine utilization protein EutN|nr:EutN/CcmL family microcompartment protein [Actinomycetota bacterium]